MILLIPTALFVVLFLILSSPLMAFEWLYRKTNPKKADLQSLRIVQWAFRMVIKLSGTHLTVNGLDNIPKGEAVLYVGNHKSIFDIVTTYQLMPDRTGYVAKVSVLKIPLLRTWMKRLHCLFLDRNDKRAGMQMILDSIQLIKDGISVFIFPEGTRGKTDTLAEFKPGSVKMASKTGCAIIPVAIKGTRACFEDRKFFQFSCPVTITFGEPIYPNTLDSEQQKFLSVYVQEKVEKMLAE